MIRNKMKFNCYSFKTRSSVMSNQNNGSTKGKI